GIIAGMSGSPVYIDGKLVGAVAYGFAFAKRPIGGVTPIEDILKTSEYNNPTFTIDISTIKMEFDEKNLVSIADLVRKELLRRTNFTPSAALKPIRLIGTHKGFDPSSLSYLRQVFSIQNDLKISTPPATKPGLKPGKDSLKINPADAASIPLIKGDFEFSSSGTVTHVDGDKIYLFGHPFFNLGSVDFPLHKAEVIAVVPSYQSS
ncbi:MAG: hypothetical protein GY950_01210, partial [bacterium]|nr:hypothetical protein [bacterium]